MEIRIEVLSSAESEIAMRAVCDIAELREAAIAAFNEAQQAIIERGTVRREAESRQDDAFNRTADAIEERDIEQATTVSKVLDLVAAVKESTSSAPTYTLAHVTDTLQRALKKGVPAAAVVEFLSRHNAKRVTELSEYDRVEFVTFLGEKAAEIVTDA